MNTSESKIYKLSFLSIVSLFTCYCLFIIIGLVFSIFGVLHEYTFIKDYPVIMKAIIGCFGITLVGSSIFYSRKLYKHSIRTDIVFPRSEEDRIKQAGIFMYFILRPLFSVCFSFLIILALKVSIMIISVKDDTLDTGFIYLTMFLSFFAGFSAGDILAVLEAIGKRRMERFFESHEL